MHEHMHNLATEVGKHKRLQTWFAEMGTTDKRDGYRKHKQLDTTSSKAGRIVVETEGRREMADDVSDRIHWKTLASYRRDKFL